MMSALSHPSRAIAVLTSTLCILALCVPGPLFACAEPTRTLAAAGTGVLHGDAGRRLHQVGFTVNAPGVSVNGGVGSPSSPSSPSPSTPALASLTLDPSPVWWSTQGVAWMCVWDAACTTSCLICRVAAT
ncbi:hypothetical protein V8C86DRAFT_977522 [Haematococcus lacustris]